MLNQLPTRLAWVDATAARLRSRGPIAWTLELPEREDPSALIGEILARLWLTEPGPADATSVGDGPAILFRHASIGLGGPVELASVHEGFAAVEVGALPEQTSFIRESKADATPEIGPLGPVLDRLLAGRAVWLVFEHADALLGDPELRDALGLLWSTARTSALPLHLLLHTRTAPTSAGTATLNLLDADPLSGPSPITLHDLGSALPEWTADRVVSARAILGSDARVWRRIDSRLSLSGNLLQLLFDPDSPTFDLGVRDLLGEVNRPERYGGIVRALAEGARDWGEVVEQAPGVDSASQLGPYMKALEAAGWLEVQRSLDAPPGSRRSRYRLVDDLRAFWFRCILPVRSRIVAGENRRRLWRSAVRPRVRSFVTARLPELIQAELAARPVLGVRARSVGGLWGDGYDLPISGILENGAAFHGLAFWEHDPPGDTLRVMRQQMRETRWGFGRETRLRLLFVRRDPDHEWERRVARAPDSRFLGPATLVGRE